MEWTQWKGSTWTLYWSFLHDLKRIKNKTKQTHEKITQKNRNEGICLCKFDCSGQVFTVLQQWLHIFLKIKTSAKTFLMLPHRNRDSTSVPQFKGFVIPVTGQSIKQTITNDNKVCRSPFASVTAFALVMHLKYLSVTLISSRFAAMWSIEFKIWWKDDRVKIKCFATCWSKALHSSWEKKKSSKRSVEGLRSFSSVNTSNWHKKIGNSQTIKWTYP